MRGLETQQNSGTGQSTWAIPPFLSGLDGSNRAQSGGDSYVQCAHVQSKRGVCVCGYVVASWPHSKLLSSTLSTLAPQSSPSCPCLSAHDLPSPQRCHLRQDMCVSCLAVPAAVKSCPWPRLPIAQTAAYCQAIVVLKRVGTTSPPAEIHDAATHAPPALVPLSSPQTNDTNRRRCPCSTDRYHAKQRYPRCRLRMGELAYTLARHLTSFLVGPSPPPMQLL